jgi:hypothetical protein
MQLFLMQERFTLKSSMLNRPNLLPNAQEKRFEALLKKEMMEHQHLISCHQKEMQELRDNLNLALEKFKSLSECNDKELKDFRNETTTQIYFLKDRLKADEVLIAEQRKMIEDLHQQMLGFYIILASKSDLYKAQRELEEKIKSSTMNQIICFQDFQREITILIQSLKNDLVKLDLEIGKNIADLSEKEKSDFSSSKMDKDCVLKEIRIYQKDVFYIEKKIENLYTLIERINKRGELCPKPV